MIRFSQNILKEIRPRAMTRDIDWGIAVPLDGWRENPTKKLYVWFDAVIGYLSASIEWARRTGDHDAWRQWWNDPEALSYYFMGKDNITFHSQIWPAELLAYSGKGDKGGKPGSTASSTCRPRSSPRVPDDGGQEVLLLAARRDLRARPAQPLPARRVPLLRRRGRAGEPGLRLHLGEFVRRTNDELVAGWGNLVNRTANLIAKNFGEIPAAGELTAEDEALLAAVEAAFGTVGRPDRAAPAEAGDRRGDAGGRRGQQVRLRLRALEAQGRPRERLGTILHVVAQCVADLNLVLSPFLPFSANAVDAALGGTGEVAPMPRIEEAEDLDGGAPYPIITGDYTGAPAWQRTRSWSAPRSPSRPRSSPSSTPRSSTRSSRGSAVDPEGGHAVGRLLLRPGDVLAGPRA